MISALLLTLALGLKPEPPDAYTVARSEAMSKQKPLWVLVSGENCPPCRAVEREFLATIKTKGVFVHLDVEDARHKDLIVKWANGSVRVPMLIVYRVVKKQGKKYLRRQVLVGYGEIKAYMDGKP